MTDLAEPRPGFLRAFLVAVLAYAVATLVATWPLALHMDSWIVGGPRDGPMFLWNQWWGGHAAFERGVSPLSTDLLFAPHGTSLALHTHALFPSLLTWPIQSVWGTIVAFNVSTLLSVFLSAVGGWLLVDEIVRDRRAAFLGGFAFAFCHLRVSTMVFHNLAQTHLLILLIWALWATIRRRSWVFAVVSGLFAAALLYSSYTLAVLAGMCLFPVALGGLVWSFARDRRQGTLLALQLCVPVVILGVLALPLAREMKAEIDAHGNYTSMRHLEDTDEGRQEIRAITEEEVSPLARYVLRGPLEGGRGEERVETRRASYLGWSLCVLALIGLVGAWRRPAAWWWLSASAFFLLASLGQELDLTGLVDDPPPPGERPTLPYAWLRDQPVLDSLRVPHRYALIAAVGLSVLAGFGWATVLRRVRRRRLALGLTAAVSAVVFFDFAQLPFPKTWEVPPLSGPMAEVYRAIRDDPRDCVVLDYPGGRKGYSVFSYYDTLHGKPVYLQGQIARRHGGLDKAEIESDLLRELCHPFYGTMRTPVELIRLKSKLRLEIIEQRVGWLIVSWEGNTRYENPPHNRTEPPLEERCRALTRMVRGALPLDPDFPPTLVDTSWSTRGGEFLRRPEREIEAWSSSRPAERRSVSSILLVCKLRWD